MKSLDKDTPYKLRVRQILWAQGYHCPLEVDLSHFEYDGSRRELRRESWTDIDVLGIRFDPDLRSFRVIADCKSSKESEPNRLFWIKGVMDFFGAHEGIFVKKIVHPHARALAPRLNIRVLDEDGLQTLEKGIPSETAFYAIGDIAIHGRTQALWGINVNPGHKPTKVELNLKRLYHYLQYLYWMIDEYRNVQTLIERFASVASELKGSDIRAKYLAFIGLQRLVLAILRMAGSIMAQGITDILAQSRAYLFGGPFLLSEREKIVELVNSLSSQKDPELPSIILDPPYFAELAEIVNRIIINSWQSRKMLQVLDVVIFDHLLGSKLPLDMVLGSGYSVDSVVLVKRIANLFCTNSNLDKALLDELWQL